MTQIEGQKNQSREKLKSQCSLRILKVFECQIDAYLKTKHCSVFPWEIDVGNWKYDDLKFRAYPSGHADLRGAASNYGCWEKNAAEWTIFFTIGNQNSTFFNGKGEI